MSEHTSSYAHVGRYRSGPSIGSGQKWSGPIETYEIGPVPTLSYLSEQRTISRKPVIDVVPSYGISTIRDNTEITGSSGGAAIDEEFGEIKLSTGTDSSGSVELRTIERGQYQPGALGLAGLGVRIPQKPTGNQDVKWGYFDTDNGLGFGVDVTGSYVFTLSASNYTKIHQVDWNIDTIDGTGPSSISSSFATGSVYEVEFLWYGYGSANWGVALPNPDDNNLSKRYRMHSVNLEDRLIINDPNQPINVRVDNSGSESNLDVFVGGRSFAIYAGGEFSLSRRMSEITGSYTISKAEDVWEPIMSVRKKSEFRGRQNSVLAQIKEVELDADDKIEYRVTYGDKLVGATFGPVTDVTGSETCVEVAVNSGNYTTSSLGIPIIRGFLDSGKNTSVSGEEQAEATLGTALPATLWVRKKSSNATVINAVLTWEERW